MEDVCRLNRIVLNGVDVNLNLYGQNLAFCLMSEETNPNYKSGCLSIMLDYRGNPTKSTAIATFPPTVVYLTSSIKRYSSASIVKKRLSRRARANIGWSRQSIRLYLIVLEEGILYPPAMIRTFFKRNSIQCTYNSSQI